MTEQSLLTAFGGNIDGLIVKSFANLQTSDLMQKIGWYSLEAHLAYKALGIFHFSDFADRVRADLADNFERHRLTSEADLLSRGGEAIRGTIESYEKEGLNDYIRKKFISAAVTVLAKNGDKRDEQTVRRYLNADDDDTGIMIAEYLGGLGSNADARVLLGMAEKLWRHADKIVAIAYRLSEDPKALILDKSLSDRIRTKVIARMTNEEFLGLREHWISFLSSEHSDMRKRCAYKVYEVTTSKKRKTILDEYVAQPTYYYDVVFWLDRLAYATRPWQKRFASSLRYHLEHPYSPL